MEVKRFYGLLLGLMLILGISSSAMGQIAGMIVRVTRPDSGKVVAIGDSIVVEVSNTLSSIPDSVYVRIVQASSVSDTVTTGYGIDWVSGTLPYSLTTKFSRKVDGTVDTTNRVVSSISALSTTGVKTFHIAFQVKAGDPEKLSRLAVVATAFTGNPAVATQLHSFNLTPTVSANPALGLVGDRKAFGIDGLRPVIGNVDAVYLDAGTRPGVTQPVNDGTANETNRGFVPRRLPYPSSAPYRFGFRAGETMGINIVLSPQAINDVAAGNLAGAVVLVDTLKSDGTEGPGLSNQTTAKIKVSFLASALLSPDTTKSATDTTSANQIATRNVAINYSGKSVARKTVTVAAGWFGNNKTIRAQVFLVDAAGNLSGKGDTTALAQAAATATGVTSTLTYLADTVAPAFSSVYPDTAGKRFTGRKSITADTMNASGSLVLAQTFVQRPLKWTLSEVADSMTIVLAGKTYVRGAGSGVQASGTADLDVNETTTANVETVSGTFVTLAAAGTSTNVVLTAVDSVGNSTSQTVTGAILDTTALTFTGRFPVMVNHQGKDTINAATSSVVFTLSEAADSIRVTYRKAGAGGAKSVTTTARGQGGGNPNINLTSLGAQRIDVTTDSLQDQTFYTLQMFGRDLAYNWTITGPDTLFYNLSYKAPKADTLKVVVASTSNDTVVVNTAGSGVSYGVLLDVAASDTTLKLTAITYNPNGVLVDVWSPDTTKDLTGVHIRGTGVTEQVPLVGKVKRATLDNGGWLLGARQITISDTLAQGGLYVTVRDTVSTNRIMGQSVALVFQAGQMTKYNLMVADTSNVPAGKPFALDVQPQDKFGNASLKQADAIYTSASGGNALSEIYVEFASNNADMGVPSGPQRLTSTGLTSFQFLAPMTNGRVGITARTANFEGISTALNNQQKAIGTIWVWVTGGGGVVTPPPGGDPTVAKPDTLIVEDYKGPDGSGDQGGFVLVTFKNTTQHAQLSQYRIWRLLQVSTRYDTTTGRVTTLTAPMGEWVAWAVVDAMPSLNKQPITRAVIPTLDNVATQWAITAEMGNKSSEAATSSAAGAGKVVFSPESVKATLALLGIQSVLSSEEVLNVFGPSYEFTQALLGDRKDLLVGRLDLEALRRVAVKIPEGIRAQEASIRASEATLAAAAVRAIDNLPPAAVSDEAETHKLDTREVTLTWTLSKDDRIVGLIPYRGYAVPIPGVRTYDVYRGADEKDMVKVTSLAAGSTTFKDVASPDLGNKVIYRITGTDLDNATPGRLITVDLTPVQPVGRIKYFTARNEPVYLMLDPNDPSFNLTEDFEDFFVFADVFGKSKGDPGFNLQADTNDDGVINFDDFFMFADAFGKTAVQPRAGKLVARATPTFGANRDAGLNLIQASERVVAGQQLKLDVTISNATALKGYGFTLTYDAQKFELVEATAGEQNLLSQGGNTPVFLKSAQPGRIYLANAIAGDGAVAGSGNVARLVFNVKGEFDDVARFEIADGILVDGSRLINPVVTLGALEVQTTPTEFALKQNFPNPFNPETTIKYALAAGGNVELRIYNMVGQVVRTLVNERQAAGRYSVRWDGKDDRGLSVSSGIYFYRFAADKFHDVKKLMLLK